MAVWICDTCGTAGVFWKKSIFSLNSSISFWPTKITLSFSINAFAAVANFSAFWTISQSLDFLITFCWINDLGLPSILSTVPFPWEVAIDLQVNGVLRLHKAHSISVLEFWGKATTPYYFRVNDFCWWNVLVIQMKQKCCNSVFMFFVLNQNKLKMSCKFHHRWWQ